MIEEVIALLRREAGSNVPISPDTDIFKDLGVDGDAWRELLEAYHSQFGVNLDGFRWYFHHGEEGWPLFPRRVSHPKVERIALTPRMLADYAKSSNWDLEHPPHTYPDWRWEWSVFPALVLTSLVILVIWLRF